MQPQGASQRVERQVPQLASGWETRALSLSPAEGFLLSRIDGRTPWTLLREIGGIAPGEADRCLERWLAMGLVVLGDAAGASRPPAADIAAEPSPAGTELESQVDPTLQIPVEAQRRILAFEAGLERPYHQILGVARGVETKTIKRAYFALSKEYHPDRYYKREIGPYAEKLDRIFKRIVEAYELLMDPTTRAELERSMGAAPVEAAGVEPAPAAPEAVPAPTAAPPTAAAPPPPPPTAGRRALARLHRQFRIPDAVLAERKARAREFHAASLVALRKQRWLEAAASARLAIAFDPWNAQYKTCFGEAQAKVNEARATELLARANASADGHAHAEALRLFEEALHYRPHDPAVNARAAELALETRDLARAREYAERACELRPEVAAHHRTLGRVLAAEGLVDKSELAFTRALELDPKDAKAGEELKKLRLRKRRSRGGKR
jgi:tetratricopeptide (TPR) repeat protein